MKKEKISAGVYILHLNRNESQFVPSKGKSVKARPVNVILKNLNFGSVNKKDSNQNKRELAYPD